MKVPRTVLIRTVGTASLLAATAGVSLAVGAGGDRPRATAAVAYDKIAFAVLDKEPIQGVVTTARRSKGGKAKVAVSLHGLSLGSAYRVIGSRRKCSRRATEASSWVYIEITDRQSATKFAESAVTGKVMSAKSVRVFESPEGAGYTQVACGVLVLNHDYGFDGRR
jgi:hypothetical protein